MPLPLPPADSVDLLPFDSSEWDWKAFERFCLGLVEAQPDVEDAHLYGTRGEKQRGIDILAKLKDGRTRSYQCRKWQSYTKTNAKSTVEDTEINADEHVILVACEVGTSVRDYIAGLDGWTLLDKEDLSQGVRAIEQRERARRLVEDTFTVHWRRAFLGPSGPLCFHETDDYFGSLLDETHLFRHTWALVGRSELIAEIQQQLANRNARVLVMVGRGGIGKTRVLRELADVHKSSRTVLFADDQIPLTAESVEELPWTGPLVIVDDAHRRDDLGALISAATQRQNHLTLVLATRPHRADELRSRLSLAGLAPEQVWISDPLDNLPTQDVRALAVQALGPEYEHLAEHLAAATADCPLVTVIGGQLLTQQAVAPELLERHAEFRMIVLDRFRDEMLGKLGEEIDAAAAREALVLISALGPLSMENARAIERMSTDLHIEEHELRALLSGLEQAGVLTARGRLRRIVPDVLADHILHRACVDRQGHPTGRAEGLLARYGEVAIVPVLRNLAELDWRIGQDEYADTALLEAFWSGLREEFLNGDADDRLLIIQLIKPVARLAPAPVFEIVKDALAHPSAPATARPFGNELTDMDVRRALPELLGSIALTPRFLPEALDLLWQLGSKDTRRLPPNTDHALRQIQSLASYELPLLFPRAVLKLAERALQDDTDCLAQSPLEMLEPLLARECEITRAVDTGIQISAFPISAKATADIRAAIRAILIAQATKGGSRDRVIAARLLSEALVPPLGVFGRSVSEAELEEWHEDQLANLDAVETVMKNTEDPHVRLNLRTTLGWHAEGSAWEDVGERAKQLSELPATQQEILAGALRNPIDVMDQEGSTARLNTLAQTLATETESTDELAALLDTEIAVINTLPEGAAVANASPLLIALDDVDPELAEDLARWCTANPDRALAQFGGTLLAVVRSRSRDATYGLIEGLRGGEVPARRQLADYLFNGTWFGDSNAPEAEMLRELVADEDLNVVNLALHAVLRLAQVNPELAIDIALASDIHSRNALAEALCMAISRITGRLQADQVPIVLDKLRVVPRLGYYAHEVLSRLSPHHRDEVLTFLLDRANAGGEIRGVSSHDNDIDLLGGATGEELLVLLRRVRDALLDGSPRLQFEAGNLYWRLAGEQDAALTVLQEWLAGIDEEQVDTALMLMANMPWDVTLTHPQFVEATLNAAHARSADSLAKVAGALLSVATAYGDQSRTMGEPPSRHVRLRDEGRARAKGFNPGSPTGQFYETVVTRAEARLREAEQEDEEYSEIGP
jgi:hypothetical protein